MHPPPHLISPSDPDTLLTPRPNRLAPGCDELPAKVHRGLVHRQCPARLHGRQLLHPANVPAVMEQCRLVRVLWRPNQGVYVCVCVSVCWHHPFSFPLSLLTNGCRPHTPVRFLSLVWGSSRCCLTSFSLCNTMCSTDTGPKVSEHVPSLPPTILVVTGCLPPANHLTFSNNSLCLCVLAGSVQYHLIEEEE